MKKFVLLSIFAALVSAPIYADDPLPGGPGIDPLQVICDPSPIEDGLAMDRTGVHATTIQVQGKTSPAWVAENSVMPAYGWLRSFRFHVTDPRFQKGGRPVVEMEITAYLPRVGDVFVTADTPQGGRRVADQWLDGKDWKVLRFSFNDAFFGGRPDVAASNPPLQGFDFRIDAANCPLYLRSVKLIGYDTEHDVVWSKMLQAQDVSTPAPGGVLLWQKGAGQKLNVTLRNYAELPASVNYRLRVTGYDDQSRAAITGTASVPASGGVPLALNVDTGSWPLGPYDGTLELFLGDHPGDAIFRQDFHLGVVSSATLDKARDGEFLYGLDPANNTIYPTHNAVSYAYYQLMGVDILRNLYDKDMSPTPGNVGQSLKDLATQNVQSDLMCDVPYDSDPAKFEAAVQQQCAFLSQVAQLYAGKGPGKIHYFELGNEPDLQIFFHGPISDYMHGFDLMRTAVKQGAAQAGLSDADTVVETGGLSFAGMEGARRAEEIIKDFDPAKIDAIAYHGHGLGIQAERHAYERVYAVAAKYGKANHPFIETESGYSGQQHRGFEDQARTAVEKMVYAQSKNEPMFIFFRLFMEGEGTGMEGGYGMTSNFIEPHPSVLTYRNMVERLRHRVYVRSLDLSGVAASKDVDGYVFAEQDAQGKPTGRKTIVLFSETPAHDDIRLRLDADGSAIGETALYDMYGNASPVALAPGQIATVPVTENPVFLAWNSPGGANQVEVVPPLLSLANNEPLLAGAGNPVGVVVHNAAPQPMDAIVSLTAQTRLAAEVSPAQLKLTVPAHADATASFTVKLGPAAEPLRLPLWWKVFTDVTIGQVDPATFSEIPDHLPGASGPLPGQFAWATGNHLDLGKLAGGFSERRAAVVFAYLDSPGAVDLPCAASADWYMAWYVNGAKVCDTLESGNNGRGLADHPFTLPLKAGRNLLAVEVLSGSGGWTLDFGGPKERQIATNGNDPDQLSLRLETPGAPAVSAAVPVQLQDIVPALPPSIALDDPSAWLPLEPLAVLDETNVKNLWMKEPDSSRWYAGKADLSGTLWLRDAGASLQLFAAITDDKLVEPASVAQLSQGDSLRVVLAGEDGKSLLDVTGGLIGDKPTLDHPAAGVTFTASRGATQTFYRLEIPKALLGHVPFRLSVSALDNDSTFLKQTLDYGDVTNPRVGARLQTKN
jgi:hypothetical protein